MGNGPIHEGHPVNVPVMPVFHYQVLHVPTEDEIRQAHADGQPDPRCLMAETLNQLMLEGRADQMLALPMMMLVGEQIGFWVAPQPRIVPGMVPTSGFIEARRHRTPTD